MQFKPWSKDFNPRIEDESVVDWLRREVDARTKHDGPTRSITITPREARQLLALIEPPQTPAPGFTDADIERAVRAHDREDAAQKGEPDPWADEFPEPYHSERLTAMRLAIAALALPARTEGGAA